MKFYRITGIFVSFIALIFLSTGCVNPYQKHYLSTVENWPAVISESVLLPTAPPQLVSSTNMPQDAHSMLEYGFVLLGRAKFQHSDIDETQALDQAKTIGAWVVLVSKTYIGTKTKSVPMLNWIPPATTTTTVNLQVQRNSYSPPVNIQKVINQTTPGQVQVNYVPVDVSYYKYAATFWAKAKPNPIGVLVQALTVAQKAANQVNAGVVVKIVVENSPASSANVLEGDVLVSMAGEQIISADQFFDIVSRNAGKEVGLNLIRNGKPITLQLQLNPE